MALMHLKQLQQLYVTLSKIKSNSSHIRSFAYCTINNSKSKLKIDTEDISKPIQYLKSDAAHWKASVSRSGPVQAGPWYQPYVITASLAVFMLYFFVLREENDIDLEFNKSLYDRIDGLEEKNLEIVLKYNKENNIPTSDVEARLAEIRSQK